MEKSLDELVIEFEQTKRLADEATNKAKALNNAIKQIMIANDDYNYTASNGIKVHLTAQANDKLNEIALISRLAESKLSGTLSTKDYKKMVKTKEYIDTDGLEDAIYNKIIDAEMVNECINHLDPIYKLTVKKGK